MSMTLFEVFIGPAGLQSPLLSDEISNSGAQIMTPQEASFVGLEGIPDDPAGRDRMLIACAQADQGLIATRLEAHADVSGFRVLELD
jgi:hypothetical protein